MLPSALPGRHTRTLLERARDCALHLGHFACAHTHAVAALHHTLAIQPDDVRARETAIDRAFETALYAHGDMPTALASLGIAQQDQLLHYVTTTPEHQYLSMGDRAALEAASELVPERQSLQRVMFLSQCEQRLFEPGCWDNQLRNRAYSLPPHDGEWLFADVRETNTLFATPPYAGLRTCLQQPIRRRSARITWPRCCTCAAGRPLAPCSRVALPPAPCTIIKRGLAHPPCCNYSCLAHHLRGSRDARCTSPTAISSC